MIDMFEAVKIKDKSDVNANLSKDIHSEMRKLANSVNGGKTDFIVLAGRGCFDVLTYENLLNWPFHRCEFLDDWDVAIIELNNMAIWRLEDYNL